MSAGASLYLAVAAGAALGGTARAALSLAALEVLGPGFPFGTLAVNGLGSLAIGFYATLTAPEGRLFVGPRARQFVMTGLCGGFTTFSLFGLETVHFLAAGDIARAALYVVASLATWLVAVWLGHAAAARLNRLGGP